MWRRRQLLIRVFVVSFLLFSSSFSSCAVTYAWSSLVWGACSCVTRAQTATTDCTGSDGSKTSLSLCGVKPAVSQSCVPTGCGGNGAAGGGGGGGGGSGSVGADSDSSSSGVPVMWIGIGVGCGVVAIAIAALLAYFLYFKPRQIAKVAADQPAPAADQLQPQLGESTPGVMAALPAEGVKDNTWLQPVLLHPQGVEQAQPAVQPDQSGSTGGVAAMTAPTADVAPVAASAPVGEPGEVAAGAGAAPTVDAAPSMVASSNEPAVAVAADVDVVPSAAASLVRVHLEPEALQLNQVAVDIQ
jgi:hypothetical protein